MITWRAEMAIGVPAIDDDHKELIAIINAFERCHSIPCAEAAARKLYKYTELHFAREESLQESFRYSGIVAHKREHALIKEKLRRLIRDAFLVKGADERKVIADITVIMHDWIIGHVLTHDLKMRSMVGAKAPSGTPHLQPGVAAARA